MNTAVLHEVTTKTQAGQMIFPEVVKTLLGAGVESYFADLATDKTTFYMTNGETHVEPSTLPHPEIALEYSAEGIIAAIRGAQADRVRYPEFLELAAKAGVIGYWAFLTGKQVSYFGRKGDCHVERFPQ